MSTVVLGDTASIGVVTLSLHDALPISGLSRSRGRPAGARVRGRDAAGASGSAAHGLGAHARRPRLVHEHEIGRATSELQSRRDLVCRLLLEKKKKYSTHEHYLNARRPL